METDFIKERNHEHNWFSDMRYCYCMANIHWLGRRAKLGQYDVVITVLLVILAGLIEVSTGNTSLAILIACVALIPAIRMYNTE